MPAVNFGGLSPSNQPDQPENSGAQPGRLLKIVGVALIVFFVLFFLFWLMSLISERDQRLKDILSNAENAKIQQARIGAIINNLAKNSSTALLAGTAASTAATATSVTAQLPADSTAKSPERLTAEKINRPYWGNPRAGLVIVEFADFTCPVCYEEFFQIREFASQHQNDILYIYRFFPINEDLSSDLYKMALCANQQNKFWPLHDRFFINQSQLTSLANANILASQVGLDLTAFNNCLSADADNNLISEDLKDADTLGVQGTPTFFVNGSKLEGVVGLADWEAIYSKYQELLK